jgi:hypothetical protein
LAYLDAQLTLSDSQALTATAASTNVIDFGSLVGVAGGEPLAVVINVEVAADNTTGNETYSVALQTDGDVAFGSAQTVGTFTIPAGAAAGTTVCLPFIPNAAFSEQYYRLNYTLGGTTPTVTLSAYVVPLNMVDTYYAHPDNITIS